jgi:pimeloyl-ACP methyl ester carboxylesterase
VLVGHSYGGAVITQASAGLDNVTTLVYLAAFGIDVGESCAGSTESFPPALLASNAAPSPYDAPGTPGGPDLYINRDNFREVFAADVPAATADIMNICQRPLSAFAFTEKATAAGWHASWSRSRRTRAPLRQTDGRDHRGDRRLAHRVRRTPGRGGPVHPPRLLI